MQGSGTQAVVTQAGEREHLLLPVVDLLLQLEDLLVSLVLGDIVLDCAHARRVCQRVLRTHPPSSSHD